MGVPHDFEVVGKIYLGVHFLGVEGMTYWELLCVLTEEGRTLVLCTEVVEAGRTYLVAIHNLEEEADRTWWQVPYTLAGEGGRTCWEVLHKHWEIGKSG